MANASFYTFAKRKNSTLQPTGTPSTIDIQLKSGTSLISPTFLLSYSGRPAFNYVIYEGRNYFINDITSVRNDLWELACTEDFLGTWKSDIGGTTALILYATGGRNDIIDQRIPPEADIITDMDAVVLTGDFTGFTSTSEGIAIVSFTGENACGTFLLTYAGNVKDLLINVNVWTGGIANVETGFQQLLRCGSAAQNLRSVINLPIVLSTTANFGSPVQIYLGSYPCTDSNGQPIEGRRVENPFLEAHATVAIPWKFSDWRRNVPYSKVYLYLPIFGTIALPSNDLINDNSLSVYYSLNMLGGDIAFQVRGSDTGIMVATGSANIAMQTPFGSSNINVGKVASALGIGVSAVASVAAGVVTGGAATLALGGGLASSAAGLISAMGGETSGGGGLSGSAVTGLDLGVKCWTVSRDITDSQANLDSVIGKPVMKKASVGTYSGYVQTDGMEVAGNMLDQEREAINNLCNGGIYYE